MIRASSRTPLRSTATPRIRPNFNDPTQFSAQNTDVVQRHREYAFFGNVSYDWAKWTFETGLRADYNNSSLTDPLYGIADEQHGTEILPKFSASYHFDKDVMGYGTISRGFQPGDLVEEFDARAIRLPASTGPKLRGITNWV